MANMSDSTTNLDAQRAKRAGQRSSLPLMPGGKGAQFDGLLCALQGIANNLEVNPALVQAARHSGLVVAGDDGLRVPDDIAAWLANPTRESLARLFDQRYLLFSETLAVVVSKPSTYDEVFEALRKTYDVHWESKYPVSSRVGWLEEFGLCEAVGARKFRVTDAGTAFLASVLLVSPEAVDVVLDDDAELSPAPEAIALLLDSVNQDRRAKAYKASPFFPGDNPIDAIRAAVEWGADRVTKTEFVTRCSDQFGIGKNSVDSFLRPLLNWNLLDEVRKATYESTTVAREWLESDDNVNLVRILHASARFIGELIDSCRNKTVRNDVYMLGERFGVSGEYCKQIIKLLLNAGVLEEPGYLRLRATALGLRLVETLPLSTAPSEESITATPIDGEASVTSVHDLAEAVVASSRDPRYDGKVSGLAFEELVAQAFTEMGFTATHIGGSGDTDVLVKWVDSDGEFHAAVVDTKSRGDGAIDHNGISSALDQHKKKNKADHVAVIGFEFTGPTVREVAKERSIHLITAQELADVLVAATELGIPTARCGLIFGSATSLVGYIEQERRTLALIPEVIESLKEDLDLDYEPGLSVREIYLTLRKSKTTPTMDELTRVVELLSNPAIGALLVTSEAKDPQYTMYAVSDFKASARRLSAIATTLAGADLVGTDISA